MSLAEIISSKYEIIVKLPKKDRKVIRIAKETITNVIAHIQLVMIALKKNSGNWLKTLPNIRKY